MSESTDVLIVGDGPAGLSAALFLAKNGMEADVFGVDNTPMHKAMLYNYLGIEEMTGSEFQRVSREQVKNFGARIHDEKVASLKQRGDDFILTTEAGEEYAGKYVIIGTSDKGLMQDLGLEMDGGVAKVDRNGRTGIEDAYAVGWATRQQKIQAIISAGDGGAAALDILSKEKGEAFHDFDTV
jgi:thioredoxin reductase